ncbi:hypothetical protein KIH39_06690 [Telmatocola sphagniphila]|jgi:hypothetical protein|uniref:Uncharacterized protein n=1 Tax=Telmatocola sphagniphila TaxID=1123043 RepID=A0A8E6B959_9BACT|nr:hypothetical protein [Telmatocola sphagniphila]QVL33594.1 hypothetical protein KIH39_06690 [Telmatocola sphagniphila]
MALPTGKIIARPMVVRACGHSQEFQHYAVDKYRAQRLAKFQQTRCSDCAAKLNEEQQKISEAMPKKGELLRLLPIGTQVSLIRTNDGAWGGKLIADGTSVDMISNDGSGPQALIVALAKLWVTKTGVGLKDVEEK